MEFIFEHRKSGPGAFQDFISRRALANFARTISRDTFVRCRDPQKSWDTSLTTNLTDSRFVVLYTSFLTNARQLSWRNGAETACVSGSAGQVVNYSTCQPIGVRLDGSDSLGPAIFLFSIKMRQQGGSSLYLYCLLLEFILLYPAESVKKPGRGVHTQHPNTIYNYFCDSVDNFAAAKMVLQKFWYASSIAL